MKSDDPFRKTWRDYLTLTNRDRKALAVLFVILFLEIILLYYLKSVRPQQEMANFNTENLGLIVSNQIHSSPAQTSQPEGSNAHHGFKANNSKPFNKDRGYSRIRSNVDTAYRKSYPSSPLRERPFIMVDLATADSIELEKLPCIGKVKARIIREYREKLGGFYSINQLLEAWGINDSIFEIIRPHIFLSDSVTLRKIGLNAADAYTLGHHPYLNRNLGNVIVNYRKQHGVFRTIEEIRKISLLDEQLYLKIAPYLTVEP